MNVHYKNFFSLMRLQYFLFLLTPYVMRQEKLLKKTRLTSLVIRSNFNHAPKNHSKDTKKSLNFILMKSMISIIDRNRKKRFFLNF